MINKKRLVSIVLVLSALVANAADYKYEISPMVGATFTEGNMKVDGDSFLQGGLEVQFNYPNSAISPELSFMFGQGEYVSGEDTNILQGALNGVYNITKSESLTTFAKAGLGIQNYTKELYKNDFGPFVDAGVGMKYNFTKQLALKAEGIYLAAFNNEHAGNFDNNFQALVGLTYSFGVVPQEVIPVNQDKSIAKMVDSTNKKPSSMMKEKNIGISQRINSPKDSDGDGVIDEFDKCPNTPTVVKVVDKNGCIKDMNLQIHFAFDSYKVDEASKVKVKEFAKFLKEVPIYEVTIIGHTDSKGPESYNMKLSVKRAQAVRDLLIKEGIDPKILKIKGMGETQPIATNATKEGRAKNRRIEAHLEQVIH